MTRVTGDWLDRASSHRVCAMLEDAGFQALFVGGCVRNALLGAPVADLDISTDARPEKVLELAKQAGLKAVPTGIDHGTVTVIADHEPYEITTFRRDVETDGRRAAVAALNGAGAAEAFTYISTAGGAFLEWMEGKELPGVSALIA